VLRVREETVNVLKLDGEIAQQEMWPWVEDQSQLDDNLAGGLLLE
jgi:hypothetical protein